MEQINPSSAYSTNVCANTIESPPASPSRQRFTTDTLASAAPASSGQSSDFSISSRSELGNDTNDLDVSIATLLSKAPSLFTPELSGNFGIDAIHKNYERIASNISRRQNGDYSITDIELAGDVNSLTNHNLRSLGNPKGLPGYDELCALYAQLTNLFEQKLARLQPGPSDASASGATSNVRNDNNASTPPNSLRASIESSNASKGEGKPSTPIGKKLPKQPDEHRAAVGLDTKSSKDLQQLNAMSAKHDEVLAQRDEQSARVAAIDTVMRRKLEIIIELTDIQLSIVNALLAQDANQRNFVACNQRLEELLEEFKLNKCEDFDNVMNAREAVIEDGKVIELTEEKIVELRGKWVQHLDKIVREMGQLDFSPQTNLEALKTHLEDTKKTKETAFEKMMDGKTDATMLREKHESIAGRLFQARLQWRQAQAQDIWSACSTGNLDVLRQCIGRFYFFNKKAGLNALNSNGFAPIHLAAINNQVEALNILITEGADIHCRDKDGYTPLHWAAKMGCLQVAQRLANCPGIEIDALGEFNRTPLHMCVYNGSRNTGLPEHISIVRLLLDKKANVNAKTSEPNKETTALHDAVIFNCQAMVLCLLEAPLTDVMACDFNDCTPLYHAVYNDNAEIAALIVGHKWTATKDSQNRNHRNNLLAMRRRGNSEEMTNFLRTLKG